MADFTEGTNADWVAALRGPDASVEEADAALETLATEYPNLEFQSSDALQESVSSFIDGFLNFLTGLVGLAIFIALIGIANTMALSVFERYREIGLLRAVGMTRRQTRRMIRWEAAIISAVGAVLGALIGVALGALIVAAIPDEFLSITSIPILRIVVMVLIAAGTALAFMMITAVQAAT